MRDLLFLAHRIPFPPDKGDRIRSFHILQHLASRFRLHLGCFSDDRVQGESVAALRALCSEVFCLPLQRPQKISRAVRALSHGTSISEETYSDRRMGAWVRNKVAQAGVGNAFIFCSAMFPYVRPFRAQLHLVTDLVDVDSEKWAEYAKPSLWPLSAIYRREQRKLFELEKSAVEESSASLFVSHAEAECFRRLAPALGRRTAHLENGVDLERFDRRLAFPNPFPPDIAPIVFTGTMNYRPNVDAVNWFARKVMPPLGKTAGFAEFWIVGAEPDRNVRQLAKLKRIRVTGAVPDVRPYLAHSACVVAPLRIARGIQNKVLEAMAMANAVVVTAQALEGLSAVPNCEVLVADTPEEFVRQVSSAISESCDNLRALARLRVEKDYNWASKLSVLDDLLPGAPRTTAGPDRGNFCQPAVELVQ